MMATEGGRRALVDEDERDSHFFFTIGHRIVGALVERGYPELAEQLDDFLTQMLEQHPAAGASGGVGAPVHPDDGLSDLLTMSSPEMTLDDVVLHPSLDRQIRSVVQEQLQCDRLRRAGLRPSSRLLFVGPSGTGKTMVAQALAGELGLPLLTVRLDKVFDAPERERATRVYMILDALAHTRGVYLFDDIDIFAARCTDASEVGTAQWILHSSLRSLTGIAAGSLVVAATSHPELLDRATASRFDTVLLFSLPDEDVITALVDRSLAGRATDEIGWPRIVRAASGLSQAEIVAATDTAIKRNLLAGGGGGHCCRRAGRGTGGSPPGTDQLGSPWAVPLSLASSPAGCR